MKYEIDEFDVHKTDESGLKAYYEFFTEILTEARPDEPKRPYEKFIKQILIHSESFLIKRWVIWENDKIIAYTMIYKTLDGENQHFPIADIFVLPEYRRKGIGIQLLRRLHEEGCKLECTKYEFSSFSNTPSGTEFLKEIGAEKCMTEYVNQLLIKDLEIDLMDSWIKKASERAGDYELELWVDEYPEDQLERFVKLYNDFWNSLPVGSLDYEYEELTPARLKNEMKSKVGRGWKTWTMVARHKPTGDYAGFTNMTFTGFDKEMINQGNTGVAIEHRNKGIGRWIKAALIKQIISENPDLKRVRSENAVTNKAMLNINDQMRFKPLYSESYWQISDMEIVDFLRR